MVHTGPAFMSLLRSSIKNRLVPLPHNRRTCTSLSRDYRDHRHTRSSSDRSSSGSDAGTGTGTDTRDGSSCVSLGRAWDRGVCAFLGRDVCLGGETRFVNSFGGYSVSTVSIAPLPPMDRRRWKGRGC